MANQKVSVHDPEFVNKIIFEVKSSGHFDAFRKECLSDVDVNPAYQNLHSRVEDSVQKFLNRQVYTPDTNKIRLREDMRMNIIRAGFLDSGVSRIVDQVVEQKMDYIQSKVEEILYNYIGIEKPIKEEKKNGPVKGETELMPNDLEQVSDKTSLDSMDMKEEIEEEIIDDDFESPAFEPIEVSEHKNENTQGSNLSEISGLTSQDSLENKSGENEEPPPPGEEEIILEIKRETELSQISTTTQDHIPEVEPQAIATALTLTGISGEEAQMAPSLNDSLDSKVPKDVNMSNELDSHRFDLNKDHIEFTGTERKNITLDDSTNSGESEKVLQPQDVQGNTMEIDNLYENDTTDSSEVKMEIDLKDESTQNTATSSKIEENSSQESLKEKRKDPKSERSRESLKSSHKSSRHHHSSSSSKSKHDKSRSSYKSSSEKKSSSDKEKSSSSRRDRDKERKSESSKHKTDDHHQEKTSRRRRSTDHDSNDGKDSKLKSSSKEIKSEPTKVESKSTTESNGKEKSSESPKKVKEQKSSILVKYDYLKTSPTKSTIQEQPSENEIKFEEAFHGFKNDTKSPHNPWFDFMDLMKSDQLPKPPKNNNYIKKDGTSAKKLKAKAADANNHEHKVAPSQRYDDNDLYKPKFDFRRRRTQILDENNKETAPASN